MNGMTALTTALLDLSHELSGADLKLIIGGGFSIYLKYRELLKTTRTTLLSKWPEPRSTNDLDLFLRTELLADSRRLVPLVQALEKLGYKPGPGGGEAGSLKVDFLAGPEPTLRSMGIKAKNRRAYPKPKINLHAHTLDEALTLEEHLQAAIIDGRRSNGKAGRAEVFLPHSFCTSCRSWARIS
jgi:hypothetical protein